MGRADSSMFWSIVMEVKVREGGGVAIMITENNTADLREDIPEGIVQ